ncbi:MAG: peptidase M14 [Phycisphaerales bacterium]|nr:peptidase M14 [Phycisphaerales bacterium]
MKRSILSGLALGAAFVAAPLAVAQPDMPSRVSMSFNHYSTYAQIETQLKAIAAAYPELVTLTPIGTSHQGRTLWVATVNPKASGPDAAKPAMWIDGNVHGNEIQAAEAVVYTLWYLTKSYGVNPQLTALMNRCAFYLCPSANPDGRESWFTDPHTPDSSRQNIRPLDDDQDGLIDEDRDDDLDGDGSITQMWKADPDGAWLRDKDDPRVFRRVEDGKRGEWTLLGEEGLDNDGDGRINEDGIHTDDMNRNYPADWQPPYVQMGAGEFPFSSPETFGIARFIMDHPNIAAVQSYHNSGGMILRGPGTQTRESLYGPGDQAVYDEFGRIGAEMLPYYRYMIIYRDLYEVHGGFVNWTAESLGIISFTNELWSDNKYFQRDVASPSEEQTWIWRDKLAFGQTFKDYTEFDHPLYGKVLIGGQNKWARRNTPTFMLEEECHRNFAFTMFHASEMPEARFDRAEVKDLGAGLWSVTVQLRNDRLIPTRTGIAATRRSGLPDLLTLQGAKVVASGRVFSFDARTLGDLDKEPARVLLNDGVPSRGRRLVRFIVEGPAGAELRFRYEAEKSRDFDFTVTLRATP